MAGAATRNLTYTAPYLHNGSVKTIQETVRLMASVQLGKERRRPTSEHGRFPRQPDRRIPEEMLPRLPPTPGDLIL